jgi:hypothetical protein
MKMVPSIGLRCYRPDAFAGGSNFSYREKGACGLSELLWIRDSNKAPSHAENNLYPELFAFCNKF